MEVAEDLSMKSSTKSYSTRKTGSRKKRRKQSEPRRLSLKFDDFSDKTGPSWSSKQISDEDSLVFAREDSDGDSGILSLNTNEVKELPFSISRSSSELMQTDLSEEETQYISSNVDEVCTGPDYVFPSEDETTAEKDTGKIASHVERDDGLEIVSDNVGKAETLSGVNWQHKIFRTNDSYGRSRSSHVCEAPRHEKTTTSFIKSTNPPENEFDTIRFETPGPQCSLARSTIQSIPSNHEINNNNAGIRRTSKKTHLQHLPHGQKGLNRSRRIVANARERNRVHTISAAFEGLRRAVPCYSHNQKLSKLAILRIACSYILALANLADLDYSPNQKKLSFSECVDLCTRTLQAEGRSKRKKTQD